MLNEKNQYEEIDDFKADDDTISLADIFRYIFKGKLIGLITGILLFLISFIILKYFISPKRTVYTATFNLSNIPNLDSGTYLDGSTFNYNELISYSNVNNIVEENKSSTNRTYDASKIDVDLLLDSSLFTITQNITYFSENNTDQSNIKEINYVLQMPSKAFESYKDAKNFAYDLINLPLKKTLSIINSTDFNSNITSYSNTKNFELKINYLNSQITLLNDGLSKLHSTKQNVTYTIEGKTYNSDKLLNDLNALSSDYSLSTLSLELEQFGYVGDKTNVRENYTIQMNNLVKTHSELIKQRDNINATYNELSEALKNAGEYTTSDQILALITKLNETLVNQKTAIDQKILENEIEQSDLQIKIDALETLSDEDNKAFENKLDVIKDKLVELTNDYETLYKYINTNDLNIYATYSSSSSLSNIMVYGVPAVLFILGFVVFGWVYGAEKEKKELANKAKSNN